MATDGSVVTPAPPPTSQQVMDYDDVPMLPMPMPPPPATAAPRRLVTIKSIAPTPTLHLTDELKLVIWSRIRAIKGDDELKAYFNQQFQLLNSPKIQPPHGLDHIQFILEEAARELGFRCINLMDLRHRLRAVRRLRNLADDPPPPPQRQQSQPSPAVLDEPEPSSPTTSLAEDLFPGDAPDWTEDDLNDFLQFEIRRPPTPNQEKTVERLLDEIFDESQPSKSPGSFTNTIPQQHQRVWYENDSDYEREAKHVKRMGTASKKRCSFLMFKRV